MCFNRHKWFSWACSVLFFISGVFYIILGATFCKDEKAKFRKIMTETGTGNVIRDVKIQQNSSNPKI